MPAAPMSSSGQCGPRTWPTARYVAAAWQAAYPELDFAERLDWWRERWRRARTPGSMLVIATPTSTMIGFVTVDPAPFYLDQIVVAPECIGAPASARR